MASMANPRTHFICHKNYRRRSNIPSIPRIIIYIVSQQKKQDEPSPNETTPHKGRRFIKGSPNKRREIILRSSEITVVGAIFHLNGAKPNYLGVQKNPAGLALCPATKNCVSTRILVISTTMLLLAMEELLKFHRYNQQSLTISHPNSREKGRLHPRRICKTTCGFSTGEEIYRAVSICIASRKFRLRHQQEEDQG
ncbi:hypothetical protein OROHE_026439 [Orobanche hederae]